MSLNNNDVCLLDVDYNLYEEETSDHAFTRSDKLSVSGGKAMEAQKRIRREIANSNERRRMQSINAGFQALRTLLPRHEGEKLSKAAILQQTAEYIYNLEQEKTRLLSQNCQLKRLLNQHEGGEIPLKKRKSEIIPHVHSIIPDSTEDSLANSRSPEPVPPVIVTKKDVDTEYRIRWERERRLRLLAEERANALDAQLVGETAHEGVIYEETEVVEGNPESEEEKPSSEAPSTPLLEAAIKAEPRVEVEVLPEGGEAHDAPSRLYLASTSRQNLETIVEAIRHLEGDHLFGEAGAEPLALTKKEGVPPPPLPALPPLPVLPPLPPPPPPPRPGVIVVKHS